ncbi:uncharacterized protein CTRU02_208189 [Colletotrichum truncatum]|uniref:Uncharacterized protein n=1 Tax=Colletotrichum truncatum TaxID=5467 RepID=A0ACC3YVL9_COLTU|nr:uncharacterized protein CTRU02_07631 [Colletotrichum truncatum]KAF6791291.1 hypothetical protein CTRU02_07631 [Colletotrichum truncatum]
MATNQPDSPPTLTFAQRLKKKKKEKGLPVSSSDEDEPMEELGEGVTILSKMPIRMVTLHPGNIVKKSGKQIYLEEADALRVAAEAKLPVPHIHGTETTPDGKKHIYMNYIEGDLLSDVWPGLSIDSKNDIAQQLRAILVTMRSIPPPKDYIGDCSQSQIRDTRSMFTYTAPPCGNEKEFNDYLTDALFPLTPPAIRNAFSHRLQTNHRIVLTHGDLTPRNTIVRDGKIAGIIDWEDAGWYPEYWEYVKFLSHSGTRYGDWWCFVDDILPQAYPDELVDYIALSKWQSP